MKHILNPCHRRISAQRLQSLMVKAIQWVTLFGIECGLISANGNLKLQKFPAPLSRNAVRWFNNCTADSIKTWEFQSMEIPIKMEHLKQWQRGIFCCLCEVVSNSFPTNEGDSWYKRSCEDLYNECWIYRMLLSGEQYNTFEQLFETMLVYEELGRDSTWVKNAKASSKVVTNLRGRGREVP